MVLVDTGVHKQPLSTSYGLNSTLTKQNGLGLLRKCSGVTVQIIAVGVSPLTAIPGFIFRYLNPDGADSLHTWFTHTWNRTPLWQRVVFVAVSCAVCVFSTIALLTLGFMAGSARLGFTPAPSKEVAKEFEKKNRQNQFRYHHCSV